MLDPEQGVKRPSFTTEEIINQNTDDIKINTFPSPDVLGELSLAAPPAPSATPVGICRDSDILFMTKSKTLETLHHGDICDSKFSGEGNLSPISSENNSSELTPLLTIKEEQRSDGDPYNLSGEDTDGAESSRSPKSWTQKDMDSALEALKTQEMSLTKASTKFGIPPTTLWQRAHRLGIDTPKKEGSSKSWTEEDLRAALQALRDGVISANKASKAYGIPSSTLYKIARREGIRLSTPFNAAPTSWRRSDLQKALVDIKRGQASVQSASSQYGIPTGTLYGRCKREGIELSRTNPTPWSEDAMGEALEAVRIGQMSINQAAIHFNLPYSSLYGRFKRCKYSFPDMQDDIHLHNQEQETETSVHENHDFELQQNPIQTSHSILNDEDPSRIIQSSYIYGVGDQDEHDTLMLCDTPSQNFSYSGQAVYYNHGYGHGIASS